MKILDILCSPWAIVPNRLKEIRNIYQTHMRGPKIDWKAIEAQVKATAGGGEDKPYEIQDGVAIIPIQGVLTKGFSFFSFFFGGSSMRSIGAAIRLAAMDPSVIGILLDIDSPGGTVDGTQELAGIILEARKSKRVVAYSDGIMASAAYWIGSAAHEIFISGDTVDVGSIGVLATHIDYSEQDKMFGEKFTEITAGKYKRIVSSHQPLSQEGAALMQDRVDQLYSIFVDGVAKNRGVSQEKALAMADGKIFIGKAAVDVGLVDDIAPLEEVILSIAAGVRSNKFNISEEENQMTLEELKTKLPQVFAEAVAIGRAEGTQAMATAVEAAKREGQEIGQAAGVKAGAEAERKRIQEIRAQAIPGHEKIIDEAIADGKSTAGDVAIKIVAAEKAVRTAALENLRIDGAHRVPDQSAEAAEAARLAKANEKKEDAKPVDGQLEELTKARMKENPKLSYAQAFLEVQKENPILAAKLLEQVRPKQE